MSMGSTSVSVGSFVGQKGISEVSNQDWVCVKCNNLNFSFRKKCNRCKVQSREDN